MYKLGKVHISGALSLNCWHTTISGYENLAPNIEFPLISGNFTFRNRREGYVDPYNIIIVETTNLCIQASVEPSSRQIIAAQ